MNSNEKFTVQAIPNDVKIRRKNCLNYCNKGDCLKMFSMQKDLNKCRVCNLKGLCYKKKVLGGICSICSEDKDFVDCNKISNYGCTNPENIMNFNGVNPYYVIVKDKNITSATLIIEGDIFKLYFDQSVDLNLIKDNLIKKQSKYQEDLNKMSQRLSNKGFVERAPKNIVDLEKTNYSNLKNDIKKISLTIKNL